MSDRPHAIASPSKAEMWLNCANSLAMAIGQPEGDKSAADLGTDKHSLLTDCLQFNVRADTYIGRIMPQGHTVDKGFANDVQSVVDNVLERINQHKLTGGAVQVELEQEVPIDHITGEQGATGTADIVLIVGAPGQGVFIDVIDAKFGYQEVIAENNYQLQMYAAGAAEKFSIVCDIRSANLIIEQPLRGSSESAMASSFDEFVEFVKPKAEKALSIYRMALEGERALKKEDFKVTEKGCKWCPAKAVCPALESEVQAAIEEGFEVFAEPDTNVQSIPVEKLGEKFAVLNLVETWVKAVRSRVESEMLNGVQIPGLKLVSGKKGNRIWASEEEAEALMKKFKMKKDEMYSFKLLGPKPILEILKEQPRRLKQIESLVIQSSGKPTVALESDKRSTLEVEPLESGFKTENLW